MLFNDSPDLVILSAYTLQYATVTKSQGVDTQNAWVTPIALSGTVQPFSYFLISSTPGTSGGNSLTGIDLTLMSALAFASTLGGKVALTAAGTVLAINSAADTVGIIDLVGYGAEPNAVVTVGVTTQKRT